MSLPIFHFEFSELLVEAVAEFSSAIGHAAIVEREGDVTVLRHVFGKVVDPAARDHAPVRAAVIRIEHGIAFSGIEVQWLEYAVVKRFAILSFNRSEFRDDVRIAIRPVRMVCVEFILFDPAQEAAIAAVYGCLRRCRRIRKCVDVYFCIFAEFDGVHAIALGDFFRVRGIAAVEAKSVKLLVRREIAI